jgi:hypothetical protein
MPSIAAAIADPAVPVDLRWLRDESWLAGPAGELSRRAVEPAARRGRRRGAGALGMRGPAQGTVTVVR